MYNDEADEPEILLVVIIPIRRRPPAPPRVVVETTAEPVPQAPTNPQLRAG
jgi:hypothetical protein